MQRARRQRKIKPRQMWLKALTIRAQTFIEFLDLVIITGRNEVLAKVMFLLVSVILFTGGWSASVHAGIPTPPPWEGGTPWEGSPTPREGSTPPRKEASPGRKHPFQEGSTPPPGSKHPKCILVRSMNTTFLLPIVLALLQWVNSVLSHWKTRK